MAADCTGPSIRNKTRMIPGYMHNTNDNIFFNGSGCSFTDSSCSCGKTGNIDPSSPQQFSCKFAWREGGTKRGFSTMQAGLTKRVMKIEDIVMMADIEAPKKRGSYKKEKPNS
jgi:hypothetical protein